MRMWLIISFLLMASVSALVVGARYYLVQQQTTISTQAERINSLSADIAKLQSNLSTTISANETNLQTIDRLQSDYERVRADFFEAQREIRVSRDNNRRLAERLSRHEIGILAEQRPVLVESAINNASENVARCFELLSGATLNERERNATNERDFNAECPWLWSDNP
jgi:septal ring factor EnvC (AmiA/AmiB activator)